MFGLQGLRGGLPQPERAGRRRVVARRRPGDRRHAGAARPPARDVRVPSLPRPGLPERLPGRRLREGPGHGDRQASRRPVLRLPVLHAGLPVRCPQVSRGQGDRPQVRHVQRPARGRRGAGVRPGLPARGDRIRVVDHADGRRAGRGGRLPAGRAGPGLHPADDPLPVEPPDGTGRHAAGG